MPATRRARLSLARPVAVAGARDGVWVADGASRSATLFDAASVTVLRRIELPGTPTALAVTRNLVATALSEGRVLAYDAHDSSLRWQGEIGPGNAQLAAAREEVWGWDPGAASFVTWGADGVALHLDAPRATAFAPVAGGVYWLSADGSLVLSARGTEPIRTRLPAEASPAGALVACANSLWVSVAGGLLLVDARTLQARAKLSAPEGPVAHLVCHDGRLFGGGRRAVFSLEPAADDNAHTLGVTPEGELLGVVVSGTHLWAVESAQPTVHIVPIP